jgi:DNA-binding transcriptional ArsR family regulator
MSVDIALRALTHPGRRAMLRLILDEELTATALAERVGMSKPAASQHLSLLRQSGLVRVRAAATRRLYRVDHDRMRELREFLDEFWGDRFDRLRQIAELRAGDSVSEEDRP